jgi:hypothetical protein
MPNPGGREGPWCSDTTGPVHRGTWHITAGTPGSSTPWWAGAACDQHLAQVRALAARTARPVTVTAADGSQRAAPAEPDQQPALF